MSNVSKAIPTSIIGAIVALVVIQSLVNTFFPQETSLVFDMTPLYILAGVGLPFSAMIGIQKIRSNSQH